MEKLSYNELLEAGVHFGHLRKKWNPKMLPYIFMEKKGIHIIDLYKTLEKLDEAAAALRNIARSGKKIMFVATKKQAKETMEEQARRVGMPFATERWLGGMLTNFTTIRKSIKKLQTIERMLSDGSAENMTKKERLVLSRERDKLEKVTNISLLLKHTVSILPLSVWLIPTAILIKWISLCRLTTMLLNQSLS